MKLPEKEDVAYSCFSEKIAASKKFLFWKSSCSEKVLYFEEVALLQK